MDRFASAGQTFAFLLRTRFSPPGVSGGGALGVVGCHGVIPENCIGLKRKLGFSCGYEVSVFGDFPFF